MKSPCWWWCSGSCCSPSSPRSCWSAHATRWTRLETSSRDEIATLRSDLDRANALLFSEPQVMVDWPAGSDEPRIDGDPGIVGVAAPHRVLAFGSWLEAGKAFAMEQAVENLRSRGEGFSLTLDHAARPSDRSARPRHRRPRRAAPERCQRRQARPGRAVVPARELAERSRFAARPDREPAVAGVDARRGGPIDLRQLPPMRARSKPRLPPTPSRGASSSSTAPHATTSCGRSPRTAPMPAGCRPWSPAPGAPSMCSISAPRPAAPASGSTPPKRKPCALRSPAWSMPIAARSISCPPASPCSMPITG